MAKVAWNEDGSVVAGDALRTDEHRRGAFRPEMYQFVGWYYLTTKKYGRDAVMACDAKIRAFLGTVEAVELECLEYGDFGACAICGARFAMGEVWQWTDGTVKRDLIHVGWECASKYKLAGADWDALGDERRRAIQAQKTRERKEARESEAAGKKAAARAAFFAANPGLEDALQADHHIARDLRGKFELRCSLSEGQVKLALKIAKEVAERATERRVAAPTGRVTIRGRVVSLKEHTGNWGVSIKMTVKVVADGGAWLCWSTVPSGLECERGDEVQFDADLEQGREPHFAFGKRPTKASIIQKGGAP